MDKVDCLIEWEDW